MTQEQQDMYLQQYLNTLTGHRQRKKGSPSKVGLTILYLLQLHLARKFWQKMSGTSI